MAFRANLGKSVGETRWEPPRTPARDASLPLYVASRPPGCRRRQLRRPRARHRAWPGAVGGGGKRVKKWRQIVEKWWKYGENPGYRSEMVGSLAVLSNGRSPNPWVSILK